MQFAEKKTEFLEQFAATARLHGCSSQEAVRE